MALPQHGQGFATIKCSSCGLYIDIARMGDHKCAHQAPVPSHQPFAKFANAFASMTVNQAAPTPLRPRPVPPRIDAAAANLPFMPRGPSTPSSINSPGYAQDQLIIPRGPSTPSSIHSNGRSASPATVGSGRRSPYRMPPRSATAPLPPRSPSPDLPLPQECAFPVFPTPQSRSATPTTPKKAPMERSQTDPQQMRPQGYLEATESKHDTVKTAYNPAGPTQRDHNHTRLPFAEPPGSSSRPVSPARSQTSARRPSTSSSDSRRKFSFSTTRPAPEVFMPSDPAPSVPPTAENERPPQLPLSLIPGPPRQSTTQQAGPSSSTPPSGPLPPRPGHHSARKPSVSAANRPLDEIGSVKTHRPSLSRGGSPSKLETSWDDDAQNSDPGPLRTDRRLENAPPVTQPADSSKEGWKYSHSASTTSNRERMAYSPYAMPQQAQIETVENSANANHSPSESTSSNGSNNTSTGSSSSRSSPPTSAISSSPEQEFASLEKALSAIPATSTEQPPLPSAKPEPRQRAPAKSFSRPTYATAGPPRPYPPPTAPAESKPPSQPESPMDPALKGGRLPPLLTDDKHLPPPAVRQLQYPQSATTPNYRGPNSFPELAPPPLNLQKTPGRRATMTHKGKCRGCGEAITGKSVSSADGRLTGRWHKQCFVCKTCKEPFPTMDFYVLGNDPFCNRHYHQLNKSLCSNCDRGIEGQYVETDQQKFHPHCFNCRECHLILRDNYFELNGKIYCEQHAFKNDNLGAGLGRRFPERRTTRLMMMM